jgi:hypothetical protein
MKAVCSHVAGRPRSGTVGRRWVAVDSGAASSEQGIFGTVTVPSASSGPSNVSGP